MFTDTRTAVVTEAPAERVTVQDSAIAAAWCLSDWGWAAITEDQRTDYRNRVAYAPNLQTEGK